MYHEHGSKMIFSSIYSNQIGRRKLPEPVKYLPKKRNLTEKYKIVEYVNNYLYRTIGEKSVLYDALKVFIPNFFFDVPLEAIRTKAFNEMELKLIIRNIALNADEAKNALVKFVSDVTLKSKQIFVSTRTANSYNQAIAHTIQHFKNRIPKKDCEKMYFPYDSLHQQVCSLSFYQFMKIRLRELMMSGYYVELEKTEESAIELIFVDLLNIKKIEL